jgi:pimeloyl-ACP methyl ester carboxylesterase
MVRIPLVVNIAQQKHMSPSMTRKRYIERYLDHLGRMKPTTFLAMLSAASEHSARVYLSELETPTLIIAGEKDTFTPARLSVEMAALLPQAQLEVIRSGTHVTPIEHTVEVNQLIRRWLSALEQR